jgi:hypothetical protein
MARLHSFLLWFQYNADAASGVPSAGVEYFAAPQQSAARVEWIGEEAMVRRVETSARS